MQTQGLLALYRGHSLTLTRAVPHAAIGYTVYELVRPVSVTTQTTHQWLSNIIRSQDLDAFQGRRNVFPENAYWVNRRLVRLVVSSHCIRLTSKYTGVSALPVTYPFELVRVRMALETKKSNKTLSVWSAFRAVYQEQPVRNVPLRILHFYRGFAVSFLGAVPYRGGIFLVWETLNAWSRDRFPPEFREANRHKIHLVIGAAAGTSSQVATYPLEVIRRMQQANKSISPRGFMGFRETVEMIWKTGGWKGFYAGLGIGLVKQVPMHSISLAVWQASKKFLEV